MSSPVTGEGSVMGKGLADVIYRMPLVRQILHTYIVPIAMVTPLGYSMYSEPGMLQSQPLLLSCDATLRDFARRCFDDNPKIASVLHIRTT